MVQFIHYKVAFIHNMKKVKRLALAFDEQMCEELELIMQESGSRTYADTIRHAIIAYRKKLLPDYIAIKRQAPKRKTFDNPMDKVAHQISKKKELAEAKQALIMKNGLNFCELLDGDVVTQENGQVACKYKMYEKVNNHLAVDGERVVAIEYLTQDHVNDQYRGGTKEEIMTIINRKK